MKGIHLAGLTVACLLAAGLVSAGSTDDREVRELSRRLDKLERSQAEMGQTVSRLSKAVTDLEKSVRSGGPAGDLRAVTTQRDKQDKRLAEFEKGLADVTKAVIQLQKQVGPRGELLATVNKKIDQRTTQLAKWLDEYHPRKVGSSHRDEIERIR